ncbi:uncharacterized protein LOC128867252 [Anastrepha ludens]|uniref:uncharacterized protein LOC128867252 n=1 Tax=Anastrepha ludens TaxID=28586 RepID=UPI0023B0A6AB|nr:uncharacterized protein LOC128867252 [Anastrepha ludens]
MPTNRRNSWPLPHLTILPLIFMQLFCYGLCIEKFTNVQCSTFDEKFVEFEMCRLRAVKRDVNELSLMTRFLNTTELTRNVTIRLQLMKKASGYKPFLYDISADLCEYMDKRNHTFLNIIFNVFGAHTCPLSNELVIEHMKFPTDMLKVLPLPLGEYAIFATLATGGKNRAEVKVYFMLENFKA